MSVNVIVCVKQVLDPETPLSAFKIDRNTMRVLQPPNTDPVINGFDENAIEAALRIKQSAGAVITAVSMGRDFVMDVIKKPLTVGADELVLLRDDNFETADPFIIANVLAAAIRKIGKFDLILCGRQASDWDNAQVPLGLAELLGLPCLTIAKKVEIANGYVRVERVTLDGYEILEAPLPAVVTISNELGELRTATMKGIIAATKVKPTIWSLSDLAMDLSKFEKIEIGELFIPVREKSCETIEGENDTDAGRLLAFKLREAKLI